MVGEPINLAEWAGATDVDSYRFATELIMIHITEFAEVARGARFDDEAPTTA